MTDVAGPLSSFSVEQCSFSFQRRAHKKYPAGILIITVSAIHPIHGQVASMKAWSIDRRADGCWGHCIIDGLEEDDRAMGDSFFYLFDKFGHLRPWFISDDWQKGLGIWGSELNSGVLVYVALPEVKNMFQGKGLDIALFKAFRGIRDVRNASFFFSMVPSDDGPTSCIKTREVFLLRMVDFRRIGRSNYFGYALDSSHPSRTLSLHNDLDEVPLSFKPIKTLKFPFHNVIANSANLSDPVIELQLRKIFLVNPDLIHSRDDLGSTPLYLAVNSQRVVIVRTLLGFGAESDIMRRDNVFRENAWEHCVGRMRGVRERKGVLYGIYDGNNESLLRIKFLLKKAIGFEMSATEAEYVKLKRWACTCGKCVGGWLSPKMKARLLVSADIMRSEDVLPDEYLTLSIVERSKLDRDLLRVDGTLKYLPFHLRNSMNPSFYRGYRDAINALYDALLTSDDKTAVTAASLLDLVPQWRTSDLKSFQADGGLLDAAFQSVIFPAAVLGPLGSGMFDYSKRDDEAWQALPPCRNDMEFEMVRYNMCPNMANRIAAGRSYNKIWGPYVDPTDNVVYMDLSYAGKVTGIASSSERCAKCSLSSDTVSLRST
ncbi:hypothetical protein BV25DRAFT_1860133 [Artomyces pyxidatus]|uniref:Uncharacterized protein n=1 Tax=Artomyces pyxidatus TaxID=48021 RepID=A0ACB8SUD2_9AGAM|nr:hypothetical protein BV25DRAFT_1860133 [Artomyces pyxidatus]